ncbi:uncharacterized protein RJT20DRAFT_136581 [Scheffersomyces xylosifermentans]|uniref:uncharacterized protein n=1 Tax=Scheffersomyces xylosifermentans TaxID=1304137 RepID=UPI00315C7EAC
MGVFSKMSRCNDVGQVPGPISALRELITSTDHVVPPRPPYWRKARQELINFLFPEKAPKSTFLPCDNNHHGYPTSPFCQFRERFHEKKEEWKSGYFVPRPFRLNSSRRSKYSTAYDSRFNSIRARLRRSKQRFRGSRGPPTSAWARYEQLSDSDDYLIYEASLYTCSEDDCESDFDRPAFVARNAATTTTKCFSTTTIAPTTFTTNTKHNTIENLLPYTTIPTTDNSVEVIGTQRVISPCPSLPLIPAHDGDAICRPLRVISPLCKSEFSFEMTLEPPKFTINPGIPSNALSIVRRHVSFDHAVTVVLCGYTRKRQLDLNFPVPASILKFPKKYISHSDENILELDAEVSDCKALVLYDRNKFRSNAVNFNEGRVQIEECGSAFQSIQSDVVKNDVTADISSVAVNDIKKTKTKRVTFSEFAQELEITEKDLNSEGTDATTVNDNLSSSVVETSTALVLYVPSNLASPVYNCEKDGKNDEDEARILNETKFEVSNYFLDPAVRFPHLHVRNILFAQRAPSFEVMQLQELEITKKELKSEDSDATSVNDNLSSSVVETSTALVLYVPSNLASPVYNCEKDGKNDEDEARKLNETKFEESNDFLDPAVRFPHLQVRNILIAPRVPSFEAIQVDKSQFRFNDFESSDIIAPSVGKMKPKGDDFVISLDSTTSFPRPQIESIFPHTKPIPFDISIFSDLEPCLDDSEGVLENSNSSKERKGENRTSTLGLSFLFTLLQTTKIQLPPRPASFDSSQLLKIRNDENSEQFDVESEFSSDMESFDGMEKLGVPNYTRYLGTRSPHLRAWNILQAPRPASFDSSQLFNLRQPHCINDATPSNYLSRKDHLLVLQGVEIRTNSMGQREELVPPNWKSWKSNKRSQPVPKSILKKMTPLSDIPYSTEAANMAALHRCHAAGMRREESIIQDTVSVTDDDRSDHGLIKCENRMDWSDPSTLPDLPTDESKASELSRFFEKNSREESDESETSDYSDDSEGYTLPLSIRMSNSKFSNSFVNNRRQDTQENFPIGTYRDSKRKQVRFSCQPSTISTDEGTRNEASAHFENNDFHRSKFAESIYCDEDVQFDMKRKATIEYVKNNTEFEMSNVAEQNENEKVEYPIYKLDSTVRLTRLQASNILLAPRPAPFDSSQIFKSKDNDENDSDEFDDESEFSSDVESFDNREEAKFEVLNYTWGPTVRLPPLQACSILQAPRPASFDSSQLFNLRQPHCINDATTSNYLSRKDHLLVLQGVEIRTNSMGQREELVPPNWKSWKSNKRSQPVPKSILKKMTPLSDIPYSTEAANMAALQRCHAIGMRREESIIYDTVSVTDDGISDYELIDSHENRMDWSDPSTLPDLPTEKTTSNISCGISIRPTTEGSNGNNQIPRATGSTDLPAVTLERRPYEFEDTVFSKSPYMKLDIMGQKLRGTSA